MTDQYGISDRDINRIALFLCDQLRNGQISDNEIEEQIGLVLENIAGAEMLKDCQISNLIRTIAIAVRGSPR